MSGGGGGDNEIEDTPEQRYLAQVAAERSGTLLRTIWLRWKASTWPKWET